MSLVIIPVLEKEKRVHDRELCICAFIDVAFQWECGNLKWHDVVTAQNGRHLGFVSASVKP